MKKMVKIELTQEEYEVWTIVSTDLIFEHPELNEYLASMDKESKTTLENALHKFESAGFEMLQELKSNGI